VSCAKEKHHAGVFGVIIERSGKREELESEGGLANFAWHNEIDILPASGVPRKLPRGGGHFRGHEKLTTFFGKLPSVDLFFLLTDPSQCHLHRLSKGGHLPVHLFSCLLQAIKNYFPSAKGGAMDPWPPPSVRHCCLQHLGLLTEGSVFRMGR
jgi:hypothetical protein